jgi:hypothetical protein
VVFKRRTRRPIVQIVIEFFYPRGGWLRAAHYVKHRLRRLPDEPERIARGIFAGVFISFTPLFGFHFLGAALLAFLFRGNILAALLATFIGNPLTTPVIAYSSVELGHYLLGSSSALAFEEILQAFSGASTELWWNARAIFTAAEMRWDSLFSFYGSIFLPYLVGGILPGLAVSLVFYFLSVPLIRAYQKHRVKKLMERIEKARERRQREAEAAAQRAGAGGKEPV